jgi:uncharacterized protein YaiI (UPF0178 family)
MRILVDGDSAGRRELIFDLAMEFGAEVHWVNNVSQNPPSAPEGLKLKTYLSDRASQSTDIVIMNLASRGDLLVTGDLGLAIVAVSKGCAAVSPRGHWYREDEMKQQMEFRHLRAEFKRSGGNLGGGPPAYRREDERRLADALRHALQGGDDRA